MRKVSHSSTMHTTKIQSIHDFLALLQGVKRDGTQWKALCPAHNDHEQSLSVKEADGTILAKCFAGCDLRDILGVLHLEPSDLFLGGNKGNPEKEIEAVYCYTDANGNPFEVVRFRPKGFAQRRPDSTGGYIWNLDGIIPTLYHQDEVKAAIAGGEVVWLSEGEKDVDRLRSLNLAATTNPMGAGKWRDAYTEALQGADLVIIPDNDDPGRGHANQVAMSCYGKAARIRVLELPNGSKDVSNWLDNGGIRDELERLAKEAPEWTPAASPARASFRLTKLSDLLEEPDEDIAYLWENTLIKGGLSVLAAKPKVGKSTLARNLAHALAKGEPSFLGRNMTGSGPVVYLALEEKRSEVRKHFERMGATENLPIFIHTGSAPEEAIAELRKAIIGSKALLAIVDPLQRLVRIRDLNDYSSVSLALEPLMQIARDTDCHILLIHHVNKGIAREGGDNILGSTAIFGSVDCALIMKRGESYRTIESLQRYGEDLPRTVLTFDVVTGLTSSGGSLEDVEVAACGRVILELLADNEMAEKEIKEGITDHKGGTVSKSLRLLCQEGKIQRQGLGKKGDPYLYATVRRNAGDSRDKYIEIPTIPTINYSFKNAPMPPGDDNLNTKTSPTADDLPDYPSHPCHNCGCKDHWLREPSEWGKAEWLCSWCHPKPSEGSDGQ